MSSPHPILLHLSRFTNSLSSVPTLSRRAQLRGFSSTTRSNSQTRSSTDNPPTGSTATHDSIPPNSDSGPSARDTDEVSTGSHTGISGPVSDSASGARSADINSNASSTPSGQQINGGSEARTGAGDGSRKGSQLRESPNKNSNEAHHSPSSAKKDSTQATKQGQQDADPSLKGRDEGPQSINAEKAAAKK